MPTTTTGKSFFVDLTRCIGCRACQVACKQWKKLPVEDTSNTGSYQNPPDLSGKTIRLVRFSEVEEDGRFKWLFFPEQCRHCVDPPCKMDGDMYDRSAIYQDDATGAVVYTPGTKKLTYQETRQVCPYDIPRQKADGTLTKCDMCFNRISNGLLPACVKTCPTGTMNFGDRAQMLEMAYKRLEEVKKTHPKAQLCDPDDVRVIYLCETDPMQYFPHAVSVSQGPELLTRKQMLAKVARPVKALF